jgi:VWFA-related protein
VTRILRVLIALLLFTSIFSFAQKPATSFGVLVTDDRGDAIPSLTPADFSVTYASKPIASDVKAEASPSTASHAPTPGSNLGAATAGRGLTIVVLDTIHTSVNQESNIRTAVAKFIADSTAHNQPVTLLQLTPAGLRLIHEYSAADPASDAARMAEFMKGSGGNVGYADSKMHAYPEAVLKMFQLVGEANRGIPGRKSLVWLTNIAPFEIDHKTKLLVSPVSVGQGASVLGSAMPTKQNLLGDKELKELNLSWRRAINALVSSQTAVIPIELRGASQSGTFSETIVAMQEIAGLTGGREIRGNNNPLNSIDALVHPPATYTVAVPGEAPCTSDFCNLSVTSPRASKVMAPQGIFRAGLVPPIPPADQLGRALNSPLNFAELGFSVEITSTESTGGNRKLSIRAALDPASGVVDTAASSVAVELGLNVLLPDGTSKQKASFNAAGKLPPEAVKQISENGMNVKGTIDLPPGEYDLKFVVHDKLHDRYGSLTLSKKIT